MKQFEILSGRCLVVELPEGAHSPLIEGINVLCELTYIDEWGYDYCSSFRLPPGNWQIIGMLSEITEEQVAGIVDKLTVSDTVFYYNYNSKSGRDYRDIVDSAFKTALESLESAILAEGYLLESPPTPKCGCFGPSEEGACPACDEWVESQSRVLDRERCLLLGRADG